MDETGARKRCVVYTDSRAMGFERRIERPRSAPDGNAPVLKWRADAKSLSLSGDFVIEPCVTRVNRRETLPPIVTVSLFSVMAGMAILLQDSVLAAHFGASPAADAYQLAMSFPSAAQNVLAGGAALAVLVPRLVPLVLEARAREAGQLIAWARLWLARLLLVVVASWAALYPAAISRLAHDLPDSTRWTSVTLAFVVVPTLLATGLASIEAAVLNSHRRFALLSVMPAFLPAGVALGVAVAGRELGIYAAALGAATGSGAQLLFARWGTRGLVDSERPPLAAPAGLARAYAAAVLSAALLGGILLSDTWMASTLSAGSTATYGFATRPVILLLAFATTAVGNVALPTFSRFVASHDLNGLRRHFAVWCSLLLIAAAPGVVVGYFYAPDLVRLLFERGTFGPDDTINVANVQRIYVLQVPAFLIGMMAWRMMNSLERHAPLLVMTGAAFITNLVVDLLLVERLGLEGIAWGTDAAFALWALLLCSYLFVVLSWRAGPGREPSPAPHTH